MADQVPIRADLDGSSLTGLAIFSSGETVGVAHGGTGLATVGANQLLTGNGTSALTSEANLTFDGTILKATGDICATTKVVAPALCIGSEYVLPTADGSAGQLMCTDGSGALAFATVAATSPGGSDTQIQFNNSGAFGASSNLTWDDTTLAIGNSSAADYLALRLYQGGGTSYYWDFTADVDAGDLIIGGNHSSFDLILNPSYGNVGIGTTAPDHIFHVQDVGANSFNTKLVLDLENTRRSGYTQAAIELASEYGTPGGGNFRTSAIAGELTSDQSATDIVFYSESTERARLTNAGRFGIGTTSPSGKIHVSQTTAGIWAGRFDNNQTDGPTVYVNHTGGTSTTNSVLRVDATSTNAFEVKSNGNVGINHYSPNGKLHVRETGSAGLHTTYFDKTNASAVGNLAYWSVSRADSTAYNFMSAGNAGGQSFLMRGDGNALADASWLDNQYDYAEYFESASGIASELGRAVVLIDGKLRYYDALIDDASSIIGVTRPKKNAKGPSAHNIAWNHWHDKFLTDDWGQYIMEDVTVWSWDKIQAVEASEAIYYADSDDIPDGKSVGDVKTEAIEAVEGREEGGVYERDELAKDPDWTPPADATSSTQSVRKQNPDYDPALVDDYKSREDRDEWWLIGLLGQVQIKADEPTHPSWIKMRQISDAVDMWMIR